MLAADPTIRADIEIHRQRIERKRSVERLAYWIAALTLPAALVLQAVGHTPWLALLPFGVVAAWFLYREHNDKEAGINCPTCSGTGGGVPLTSNWICGNCFKTNNPTALFRSRTFCEPCLYCNVRPSAVVCRQCREPIIFDEDEYNKHPKRLSFLPGYPPPKPEPETKPQPPTLDDLIPLADRQLHTLILAMPRVGKSEAIKCFVHSLLSQPVACFVLDPHGDMAEEIAKWPNNRLIYVKYDLQEGYTPTINPFEIYGVDASDLSEKARKIKGIVAEQLVAAFQLITEDFTYNMEAVLTPCLLTLLDKPGATIRDLLNFMIKDKCDPLIRFAHTRIHDHDNVEFFKHQFHDKHLESSKGALRTKISNLINKKTFADLTCGSTTIFLERAWNDRKIVVFNLADIGELVSPSLGALILSLLQGVANRRASVDRADRIPCHVFVDECYHFVNPSTPKAMAANLKHGFILTLAHQHLNQMSKDTEAAIHKLTHLNLIGVTPTPQQRFIAQYFQLNPDDVASLRKPCFIVRIGNNRPFRYTFPDTLIENRGAMPDHEWREVKQLQVKRFYRPIQRTVPKEPDVAVQEIAQAIAANFAKQTSAPAALKPKSKKRTLAVDDTEGDVI